jgi:hypothetical protein
MATLVRRMLSIPSKEGTEDKRLHHVLGMEMLLFIPQLPSELLWMERFFPRKKD